MATDRYVVEHRPNDRFVADGISFPENQHWAVVNTATGKVASRWDREAPAKYAAQVYTHNYEVAA